MNCVDSRAEHVQQMGGVKCVCVREQTPCLCGQEVLGHTRFWFDKDPKLSSFSACLNMVLSSTCTYQSGDMVQCVLMCLCQGDNLQETKS